MGNMYTTQNFILRAQKYAIAKLFYSVASFLLLLLLPRISLKVVVFWCSLMTTISVKRDTRHIYISCLLSVALSGIYVITPTLLIIGPPLLIINLLIIVFNYAFL